MLAYIIRRILYAFPILIGINVITFLLFFVVNTPDDMARMHLGQKHVTKQAIQNWKHQHGYDKPVIWNSTADGVNRLTDTIFYQKSLRLFLFDFGRSDSGRDIGYDISQRMWPSLLISLPTFFIGLLAYISFALFLCFFRSSHIDTWGVFFCVVLMSVSGLFYIIGGQFVFAKLLHLVPVSGYDGGANAVKFAVLPVLLGVLSNIGSSTRWYRTIFAEEMGKEYVRASRARGLPEWLVLYCHVLRNGLIPILTGVVVVLPFLFMGALVTESFFSIPGLGSYTIDAIASQDFSIVRAMVFLGAVLYIAGLLLTDLSYTLADPRIRLQ